MSLPRLLCGEEEGKAAADHVGALYNLGRITRGRGTSESKAWKTLRRSAMAIPWPGKERWPDGCFQTELPAQTAANRFSGPRGTSNRSRQYKTTSPTSPEINEQAEIKVYGHTNITHRHTQNTHTHTHFIDFTVLAEILEARAGVGTGSRTGFAWGRECQSVGVLLEFSGSSLPKNKKSCLTCSLSTPLKNTAQFRGREVLKFF